MYYVVGVVQFDTYRRELMTIIHVSDDAKKAEEVARNHRRYGYKLGFHDRIEVFAFESWHIICAGKNPLRILLIDRDNPV